MRRLDRIEKNEEDLGAALRILRKDLKEEIDLILKDISALSTMITGSSGQVVKHDEEQVSKTHQAPCDCGDIVSQYKNLMMAFKREKSENTMLRKEFREMKKQHDLEIRNVSENIIDMDSRLNNAEKTYAVCQKDINHARSYINDGLMHLNESFTNRSLNTLQEISRITSDTAKLKTSNEILKNITDNLTRHPIFIPPKSCGSVFKSGEYTIYPDAFPQGVKVYCYLESTNEGWIVIQRRKDGSVDFNRTWADYKAGFGNLSGEFWLGNHHTYQLTKDKPKQLRIDMEMFDGTKRYALYSEFKISSESEKYKLHVAGYTGDAGDCLLTACADENLHNGRSFSTFDRDNDRSSGYCCACQWGGGWWFDHCFSAYLNGKYGKEYTYEITWYKITTFSASFKFVQMSMR
ncbi:hypothetical protein DPMN_184616 [Dreissena polymorpha]|uniref:Fibrinogen C-terminal domain-containing protein n=2 Tax=Dreissena polymorpha TaxID=45954 RepID=A0A9D4I6J8_DREPO|nr:hypothetical protein DPMN_184616 [Dreissena polymorpha]